MTAKILLLCDDPYLITLEYLVYPMFCPQCRSHRWAAAKQEIWTDLRRVLSISSISCCLPWLSCNFWVNPVTIPVELTVRVKLGVYLTHQVDSTQWIRLEYLVKRDGGHIYKKQIQCSFLIKLECGFADQYGELLLLHWAGGRVKSYSALFLHILYLERLNRLIFFFSDHLYGIILRLWCWCSACYWRVSDLGLNLGSFVKLYDLILLSVQVSRM